MFSSMQGSTNMRATPIQDEHDPLFLSKIDFLVNNPITTNFELPQTDSLNARRSTPSATRHQISTEPLQSTAPTLVVVPNPNNPQAVLLTNNSATTHITSPIETNIYFEHHFRTVLQYYLTTPTVLHPL